MGQTLQRIDVFTALLVGLDDATFGASMMLLDAAGFRVIRVRHVAAAAERIPVVMPQLVLSPPNLSAEESDMLRDRCLAVGATLVSQTANEETSALLARLAAVADTILQRKR